MKSGAQVEFNESLECYVDEVGADSSRLKRAAQAVVADENAITDPFCGRRIAKLKSQRLPYIALTYASAAKLVLSHLGK